MKSTTSKRFRQIIYVHEDRHYQLKIFMIPFVILFLILCLNKDRHQGKTMPFEEIDTEEFKTINDTYCCRQYYKQEVIIKEKRHFVDHKGR